MSQKRKPGTPAGEQPLVGITFDIGCLWLKHQRCLRQLFPERLVLASPLVQIPLIRTCLSTRGRTLLVKWGDEDGGSGIQAFLEASGICLDNRVEALNLCTSDEKCSWTTMSLGQAWKSELVTRIHRRVRELFSKDSCPVTRGITSEDIAILLCSLLRARMLTPQERARPPSIDQCPEDHPPSINSALISGSFWCQP